MWQPCWACPGLVLFHPISNLSAGTHILHVVSQVWCSACFSDIYGGSASSLAKVAKGPFPSDV